TVVRNRMLDWLGAAHQKNASIEDIQEHLDGTWNHVAGKTAKLETKIELLQYKSCLRKTLDWFSKRQQEHANAVLMAALGNITTAELAQILDKKPGATRQFLAAARQS